MVYTMQWEPGFDTSKTLAKKMAVWLDLVNVNPLIEEEGWNLLSTLGTVIRMAETNTVNGGETREQDFQPVNNKGRRPHPQQHEANTPNNIPSNNIFDNLANLEQEANMEEDQNIDEERGTSSTTPKEAGTSSTKAATLADAEQNHRNTSHKAEQAEEITSTPNTVNHIPDLNAAPNDSPKGMLNAQEKQARKEKKKQRKKESRQRRAERGLPETSRTGNAVAEEEEISSSDNDQSNPKGL
ncbi:hypothetical protein R1sor_025069 [Riccia sorocarpa]|uniref:DUF4283 domain-containing protein n=1 Tax=Riccia sorocarpa TaxID=122646 RepID=A0ABD3G919_9MARC